MFDPSLSIYIFYAHIINNMLILVYDKEQIPGQTYLMSVRKRLSRDPWANHWCSRCHPRGTTMSLDPLWRWMENVNIICIKYINR